MSEPLPLPQRRDRIWLPPLRKVIRDEPRWWYPARDTGAGYGEARLRVWNAALTGHFAVVTELGTGVSVTNAAGLIWQKLKAEYGMPLGLAEHYPAGLSSLGEHVDMVLSPVGRSLDWMRLWPVPDANPDAGMLRMWWDIYGSEITG